jgi:hypothetical protein
VSTSPGNHPHQLLPLRLAHRPVAGRHPGRDRWGQVLAHGLAVHSQALAAISLCDLPACQWINISVTSTTLNVLLATHASASWTDGGNLDRCEDHTYGATLVVPLGNYVSADTQSAGRANLGGGTEVEPAWKHCTQDSCCGQREPVWRPPGMLVVLARPASSSSVAELGGKPPGSATDR